MNLCTKCNKPNDNKKSIWCFSCIESSKKKSVKTEIKPIIEIKTDEIEIPKGNFHLRFSEMYNKTWKKNPD
jgi:hypothetical protein